MPVLTALRRWGDKYLADPEGASVINTLIGCDAPIGLAYVCEAGHLIAGPAEVERRPGPSARPLHRV